MRVVRLRGVMLRGLTALAVGVVTLSCVAECSRAGLAGGQEHVTSHTVVVVGVRIVIRRSSSGVVCYEALRPHVQHPYSALASCVLGFPPRAISFVIASRHTGQQMLAGIAGPGVGDVFARLVPQRIFRPAMKEGAFFGFVPNGYRVRAIVKVLKDGTRRTFVATGHR
jgi:hypothetical protein